MLVPLCKEDVMMHAADGEAWGLSCLFLFWFCSHGGFSPEEELALSLGSRGGDPGTSSPLPAPGLFWVLAWGSAGGPVSEELCEREEVAGLALRGSREKPLQKRPRLGGQRGQLAPQHTPRVFLRDTGKLPLRALPRIYFLFLKNIFY